MTILVTVSVNLAECVSLRELRKFVDTAEQNGADPTVDLREYDDDNGLVGLAAVGELSSNEDDNDDDDDEEGDVNEEASSGDESC